MRAYQLLLAATLGGAIGAPNEVVAADKSAAQKMTPAAAQLAIEGECLHSAARPDGSTRSH